MTWYYLGREFTSEDIEDNKAFVYVIYHKVTGKGYVGKKRFQFMRSVKRKGRVNRVRRFKPSDWESYWGSCKELKADIAKYGEDKYFRTIQHLCKSTAEASYMELVEQITRDVLYKPEEYYNNYVGARIHRKHLVPRGRGQRA